MEKQYISNKDESVRIFKSDLLDAFSRIYFWVPLIIYVPVVGWFLYRSVAVFSLPAYFILGFFIVGVILWTFTEYNLHRFVFHYQPSSAFGKRIHFLFHGVHHDYPKDSKRLVMVPAVSLPLAVLFYAIFYFIFGTENTAPAFAGYVSGYLFYDMTHYALHHYNFKSKFWLELKNHHAYHHYKDHENGFGVSTKFWDHVYRTMFKKS